MPVHRIIRIAHFNRKTEENGAQEWIPNIHIEYVKRRVRGLNRLFPFSLHWVEEKSPDGEAVNIGTNPYQNTSSAPPYPPVFPPPAFPPPAFPPPPLIPYMMCVANAGSKVKDGDITPKIKILHTVYANNVFFLFISPNNILLHGII